MPVKVKLSTVVSKQIPEFIRSDHETFVKFVEAYYEFLESTDNSPVKVIRSLQDLRDVDNTLDQFVDYLQKEFIPGIPESALLDKRKLITQIHDLYRSKGTVKSYELLFRILYDETPEIYFPKVDVLRLSDGKWSQRVLIKADADTGNPFNLIGQTISQGLSSARVEDVIEQRTLTDPIYILTLNRSSIIGDFTEDPIIGLDNTDDSEITINPRLAVKTLTVTNPGSYYSIGQIMEYDDLNTGLGVTIQVTSVKSGSLEGIIIDAAGTGYSVGDEFEFDNTDTGGSGAVARVASVGGSGQITGVTLVKAGSFYSRLPVITPPDTGTGAVLVAYGADIGRINGLALLDAGYRFTSAPTIMPPANMIITDLSALFQEDEDIETDEGSPSRGLFYEYQSDVQILTIKPDSLDDLFEIGDDLIGQESGHTATIQKIDQATITATVGVMVEEAGRFLNSSGWISESTKHIQDSLFYQDYSYVIKLGQSINTYKNVVKRLLHPSGLALFGEVKINSLVNVGLSVVEILERHLLLEDGFDLLQEDGYNLLVE